MKKYLPLAVILLCALVATAQCPTGTPPAFTTINSVTFTEGTAGVFAVGTTGDPAPAVTEAGALPAGVTFSSVASFQGNPAVGTAGNYVVTLTASNGVPPNATQTFTLKVLQAPPPSGALWLPPVKTTWGWVLSNTPTHAQIDSVAIMDSDGFDTPASTVDYIHAQGKRWVCYLNQGTSEDFRSDYNQFPASVKGKSNGWAGERWLDIRQLSILLPIMSARVQICANKHADAIEWDNADSYSNSTGFPLSASDQLTYNKAMAKLAHDAGMSVALKNDGDQASALVGFFDFSIEEECYRYKECGIYKPFADAGKSILGAEYRGSTSSVCPTLKAAKINGIITNLNLTGSFTNCP